MDLAAWTLPRQQVVEAALSALFQDAWPAPFGEMCRYPLSTGGKRIRPLLVFAACEAVSDDDLRAPLSAAMAIELIHTYSLVHDDLPCMDDDDLRRGQPTVHIRYGEGNAVLVGDALLTEAFRVLASSALSPTARSRLVMELAEAAGYQGMIGGQARDVGVGGPVTEVEELLRLHRGKTGALIRCAARMGAICGGGGGAEMAAITEYAEAVGLAFQLADDLLDLEQDAREGGPPSLPKLLGADATRLRALELSRRAVERVEALPGSGALQAIARYAVERES